MCSQLDMNQASKKNLADLDRKKLSISVVIAAYNAEKFIYESCKSVIGQMSDFDELVVVDDGSTDKTFEILQLLKKEYSTKDIVLLRQENKGVCSARNKGNEVAKGQWIIPLDADDLLKSTALNIYRNSIIKNNDVDAFYADCDYFYENGKVSPLKYPKISKNNFLNILWILGFPRMPFKHSATIYKKSFMHSINGYDDQIRCKIDIDIAVRAIRRSLIIEKINESTVLHRRHNLQLSVNRLAHLKTVAFVIKKNEKNFFLRLFLIAIHFTSQFAKMIIEKIQHKLLFRA
jgi:glycosyltransferase involved in cell wall biosynthesis